MNSTLSDIETEGANSNNSHSKLQWLIILIPVVGAFFLYSFMRIKNRRKKIRDLEEVSISPFPRPTTPLPPASSLPSSLPPVYMQQNTRQRPSGLLIHLSSNNSTNNSNNRNHNNSTGSHSSFWRYLHGASSESLNQRQRRRRDERRYRRRRRRHLERTPTPPPMYSISSPPAYDETVAVSDNEPLSQVQDRLCTRQ